MEAISKENVDNLLEECKGKMSAALVAGFDEDGNAFISSSVKNVPYMHWILNRAIFELGLFEKQDSLGPDEEELELDEEETDK